MTSRRNALLGLSGIVALSARGSDLSSRVDDQSIPAPVDLQTRYDALAAAGGGTLEIPAGIVSTALVLHSRRVHLKGVGRDATILQPTSDAHPVLRATYATGTWDAVTISDMTLRNSGNGTGFGYGDEDGDRYAGRTILRNVKFAGFEKCISRPTGNIGLYLEDCQFEDASYHLWGRSDLSPGGEIMHNGVLIARRCHFQRAKKAVLYVDSDVMGSGQITFEDCIFESNPGFVLLLSRFESRDGVPGITLRSCWNEANATDTNEGLMLAGRRQTPVFLFADRVASIEFIDTPPGQMILLGDTTVITRSCALDLLRLNHADPAATLSHYDARIFGDKSVPGLTHSVANANQKNQGPTGAIFRLPHRSALVRPAATGSSVVNACREPFTLNGSRRAGTQSVEDAILPSVEHSQQLDMAAGDSLFVSTIRLAPPGGFVAWTFAYRLIEGFRPEFQVTGKEAISTVALLDAAEWTTLGGITYVDHMIDPLGFLLKASQPAAVRIGGYQIICFATRQAATEMLNDRLFRDRSISTG